MNGFPCFIVLSAAGGLLTSKPFECGMNFPPVWKVALPVKIDLPLTGQELADFGKRPAVETLRFIKTDEHVVVSPGRTACLYELEAR